MHFSDNILTESGGRGTEGRAPYKLFSHDHGLARVQAVHAVSGRTCGTWRSAAMANSSLMGCTAHSCWAHIQVAAQGGA